MMAAAAFPFYRLSGSGNDFLAFVDPTPAPESDQIRAWCRRGLSLGADGVLHLRLQPESVALPTVRLRYWNADGSRGELCFNGTRAAARLCCIIGWCQDAVALETDVGTFRARIVDDTLVSIEAPIPAEPEPFELEALGRTISGWSILVGVPHVVVECLPEPDRAAVASLGAAIRSHPRFAPAGTNVNFVAFARRNEGSTLTIRTFERGVEAETLACGSGVLASSWVGLGLGALALPIEVLTLGGLPMRLVDTSPLPGQAGQKRPTGWNLVGDARVVASGRIESGASFMRGFRG